MDISHFLHAICQEQVGFKRKYPGLCQANSGLALPTLSSYFQTTEERAALSSFTLLNQWFIQKCDLLLFDKVAPGKNQNNAGLTQRSLGKLLVHVLEKALRTPVFQLSCTFDNLDFYLLVQLFAFRHQKVQTSLDFIQTYFLQESRPTQFLEGGHKLHMPHHYSSQAAWYQVGPAPEQKHICLHWGEVAPGA